MLFAKADDMLFVYSKSIYLFSMLFFCLDFFLILFLAK